MSIECPRCRSRVALDEASGVAPEFCPYCDSPLTAAGTVQAGDGLVARDEALHPEAGDADAGPETADIAPSGPPNSEGDRPADETETAAQPQDAAPAERAADDETETLDKPRPRKKSAAPSFVRRSRRADGPTPPWLWAIAAGLALLASLQIVLADRAQLAANARWRPAIASICAALHCSIPPWREPAAFVMLGREVRQHPYMPGALRVDAAFRNNARWAQPWPDLVLTLSDVDGRALGTRTFAPPEYLGSRITQKEIGSGQTAAIRMELMEPAPGVVAFSFDFR